MPWLKRRPRGGAGTQPLLLVTGVEDADENGLPLARGTQGDDADGGTGLEGKRGLAGVPSRREDEERLPVSRTSAASSSAARPARRRDSREGRAV